MISPQYDGAASTVPMQTGEARQRVGAFFAPKGP